MNQITEDANEIYIYEVNLTIQKDVFIKHKDWLIEHFHEMTEKNDFIKSVIFMEVNMNPLSDDHFRYQKITAQYFVSNLKDIEEYLEKKSKNMRNQVFEKLGVASTISRRVLRAIDTHQPGK